MAHTSTHTNGRSKTRQTQAKAGRAKSPTKKQSTRGTQQRQGAQAREGTRNISHSSTAMEVEEEEEDGGDSFFNPSDSKSDYSDASNVDEQEEQRPFGSLGAREQPFRKAG